MTSISKKEAIQQLWEHGIVADWFLDSNQKEVIEFIDNCKAKQISVVLSRQTGKSTLALTYAIEKCLQNPNYIVTMVAPTAKQAREIAKTAMREILDSCPEHLKPEYKTQENFFAFKNGSMIQIYGNNKGKIESLRGGKSHLIICDEVGFWDDLEYSIKSALVPRTTTTKGKIILITTPPKSAGHPFFKLHQYAVSRDAAILRTIHDCPRFTEEDIDTFAEELGGYETVDFQREYLCRFLTDISKAVIPEANEELMEQITLEWRLPPYYDCYVAADFGLKDLTAVLFAYYDFRTAKVVIEDELIINRPEDLRLDNIAEAIFAKEVELWQDKEPKMRIADANPLVINDLYLQHNLNMIQSPKDDFDGGISNMRMMLSNGRVVIHPRCTNLLFHIQNATWKNDKKKDFDRSPDAGHYDAVAALMYLLRNINYNHNPYPMNFDYRITESTWISPNRTTTEEDYKKQLRNQFSTKKKR